MKVKRGLYNIIWGLLGQVITISLGIVIPRLVLVSFGSEINGLLNSITQIYAYFTLIEAGIGSATLQALYKPTAEENQEEINHILSATNRYYKKVAIIYLIAVLVFASTYPFIIKSPLPTSWVFMIICLNGLGSVINFWVQGKYTIFLSAIGKSYINTNLSTVSNVLTSTSKIVLLLNGCDVLTLQVVYLIISLLKMLFIYFYMKKNYSWIDVNTTPKFEALEQKNSVLIHQISYLIFSNTDVLLITCFLGLKEVSVYSMYLMLFTMLNNITSQLYNGFAFRLGQIYNTSKNAYIKIHDMFETYYMAFVFWIYVIAFIFVIPFLKLYTSGVTDINYLDYKLALLFLVMNLLSNGRNSSIMVINFAGHFKNTIKQSVLESAINIICSMIFIKMYGIYGVLLGTIVALMYRMIDMVVYSNHNLLERSCLITLKRWIRNCCLALIIIFVFKNIEIEETTYCILFLKAAISAIFSGVFIFSVNSILEKDSCKYLIKNIKKIFLKA